VKEKPHAGGDGQLPHEGRDRSVDEVVVSGLDDELLRQCNDRCSFGGLPSLQGRAPKYIPPIFQNPGLCRCSHRGAEAGDVAGSFKGFYLIFLSALLTLDIAFEGKPELFLSLFEHVMFLTGIG
jgi:hypothetical protein